MTSIMTKRYGCTHCGNISNESTNHYGEIYSSCTACSWKRPMDATVKIYIDVVPEGGWVPEPWRIVKLGDVCVIK